MTSGLPAGMILTLDGYHYLRAAGGIPVPSPYQRRWLLPCLLGPHPKRWAALTYASLALLPAASLAYLSAVGLSGVRLAFGAVLLCALPAHRFPLRFPVLTDAPAYTLALLTAWASLRAPWAALPLAFALGSMRESAPVFAALWAWDPWLLLGLLATGWRRPTCEPSATEPWLLRPFASAWKQRRDIGLDGSLYLRPWGGALLGLVAPTWQLALTLAVAHAQLFTALDALRLTVWAAPVLCAVAAQTIPAPWMALALLVTAIHKDTRA